jgi:peptide-methionine (R)-S-oxide reductase
MKSNSLVFLGLGLFSLAIAGPIDGLVQAKTNQTFAATKSDAEWKKLLPKATYLVLLKAGTETPYTGKYWEFHKNGTYVCAGCGQTLFASKDKFDSHTGWPSFCREITRGKTLTRSDHSDGSDRTEVICAHCGGHLGHVFDDGPEPTGLRYCMNSPALKFVPSK